MSLNLAQEMWGELKRYVSEVDRRDAADSLVHLLIDNDYDAGEIKSAFKHDAYVKSALLGYQDQLIDDDVDEEADDGYDDADDNDDY